MATWYDTGNPASADGTRDQSDSAFWWSDNSGLLSLPAGTVDSLRVYANTDNTSNGLKLALYDSSYNLVTGANGTNASEGTGAGWKTVTFSPVSISSGTYYVSAVTQNNAGDFLYAVLTGQPATTSIFHFGSAYPTGFPPATIVTDANFAFLFYMGVQVTASTGRRSKLSLLGVG